MAVFNLLNFSQLLDEQYGNWNQSEWNIHTYHKPEAPQPTPGLLSNADDDLAETCSECSCCINDPNDSWCTLMTVLQSLSFSNISRAWTLDKVVEATKEHAKEEHQNKENSCWNLFVLERYDVYKHGGYTNRAKSHRSSLTVKSIWEETQTSAANHCSQVQNSWDVGTLMRSVIKFFFKIQLQPEEHAVHCALQ